MTKKYTREFFVLAGRRGGQSKSAKKMEAIEKNRRKAVEATIKKHGGKIIP